MTEHVLCDKQVCNLATSDIEHQMAVVNIVEKPWLPHGNCVLSPELQDENLDI